MLVIDENKIKLLKMTERLLEVSSEKKLENALIEYRKLVFEIDNQFYKLITDMIKSKSNYDDLPLEKQLEILLEIVNEYNIYEEFQENVKSVCKRCNVDIQLYDIHNIINIDKIRKRIEDIKKYFENIRAIEENNIDLNELNEDLIVEEKKSEIIRNRLSELSEELRINVLKAEGRIYNSFGELEYTSIVTEADKLDFDLKQLFSDQVVLQHALDKLLEELNEIEERLKTVQMCYESNPNSEYKDIFMTTREDALYKKYKYTFLEIISLVSKNDSAYDDAKWKRNRLNELIKIRIDLLKQLNIDYLYDPFEKININEQLEVIDTYGNNSLKIKEIISLINRISVDNDNKTNQNNDLIVSFRDNFQLMRDDTKFGSILQRRSIEEKLDVIGDNNFVKTEKVILDNQVVDVRNLSSNFVFDRSLEKANGVIKRVYEMMCVNKNVHEHTFASSYSVTPQLIIEPVSSDTKSYSQEVKENDDDNHIFLDMGSELEDNKNDISELTNEEGNNIFLDLPFELNEEENTSVFDKDDFGEFYEDVPQIESFKEESDVFVEPSSEKSAGEASDIFYEDESSSIFTTVPTESKMFEDVKSLSSNVFINNDYLNVDSSTADSLNDHTSSDLFHEVQPFEDVVLFDGRYDDGNSRTSSPRELKIDLSSYEDGNSQNVTIIQSKSLDDNSNDFWTIRDGDDSSSTDIQDNGKVRKLVA